MLSDGTWTYTWEHGRELASMSKNGTTWNFTYDANGMRTARTNGSTAYSYVYNGGQLSQMTVAGNTLNFTYDASGSPLSVSYGSATYYYVTNLQGDVVAILNSSGTSVVTYTYDAWGKLLTTSGSMASTLGVHNPLRYRGYVYDTELGLYYLQSRYYDPQIGRFINGDSLITTGNGMLCSNMFAYCLNDPVNGCDPCGTCFHRLDFWNDCERCAGKTWEEKLNILAEDIYDYATDVYDAHMMQSEWQRQVDQNGFRAMRDSTVAVCDAIAEGIENQNKAQYEQDRITQKTVIALAEDPAMTFNLAVNAVGVGASIIGFGGALGVIAISPTANIVLSGVGLGCSLWGDGTAIAELWDAICE